MYELYRFNEDRALFGRQLKTTMAEKGISIIAFINALEKKGFPVNENTVKKWRSGERIPNLNTLKIIADLLGVSMQHLYLPKSRYLSPFSDKMRILLEKGGEFHDGPEIQTEIERYFEYLLQKLLFSFLSFSEKRNMEALFSCFQITEFGLNQLGLDSDCCFEVFSEKTKKLITNTYGKKLPYEIDEKKAMEIYAYFEQIISIKHLGGNSK